MSLCDLPPFLAKRLTDTLSPFGDVIGQCRMQDRCSLFLLWAVWDSGSTVSFSACGVLDCCFVVCICFCLFRVAADSFASLYVSEFLIAACGVSPLRGRPKDSALWNPAALERLANFLVSGAGLWVLCVVCCFFTGLLGGEL